MNIYLDVDGVLIDYSSRAAKHAPEFIKYLLDNYPDSTYWLTTRCYGDSSKLLRDIGPLFDEAINNLLTRIKPTCWQESGSKASAIDYSAPFLWFDDCPLSYERVELEKHGALASWVEVNLRKDPEALVKILRDFPCLMGDRQL